jgi:hypothetical protein
MNFSQLISLVNESTAYVVKGSSERVNYITVEQAGIETKSVFSLNPGDIVYLDENKYPHREDGPAIITKSNGEFWFKHGKRHRVDGPACKMRNGRSSYYQDGLLHREDGPAIVDRVAGIEFWYSKGKRHRADGPAYIRSDDFGSPIASEYWINGKNYSKSEFDKIIQNVGKEHVQDIAELGDLF